MANDDDARSKRHHGRGRSRHRQILEEEEEEEEEEDRHRECRGVFISRNVIILQDTVLKLFCNTSRWHDENLPSRSIDRGILDRLNITDHRSKHSSSYVTPLLLMVSSLSDHVPSP
ncbi:hypothetical protein M0802_005483 [Mischocyttarus mexicanus]|nr:hypothetical protein M0802_005483 [Mischocyttarus mexicanus]